MEITITQLVKEYGFNSVLIAVVVCILTGLIKMPIKSLAAKTNDPSKYTKYITFLPLILGFGFTALYNYFQTKTFAFTGEFVSLWLTSSSLSLAIYAFVEKFIPSRKKILSEEEIKQNQNMIEQLKENLKTEEQTKTKEEISVSEENTEQHAVQANESLVSEKIILRGRKNG